MKHAIVYPRTCNLKPEMWSCGCISLHRVTGRAALSARAPRFPGAGPAAGMRHEEILMLSLEYCPTLNTVAGITECVRWQSPCCRCLAMDHHKAADQTWSTATAYHHSTLLALFMPCGWDAALDKI